MTGIYTQYLVPLLDDGTDQTAAIQAIIDSLPDGTEEFPTVLHFTEGRYHTEGDLSANPRGANGIIHLVDRHNIIIEGPATFYSEAPAVPYGSTVGTNTHSLRRHFWFKGCSNITVRDIRVEGSNYTEGPKLKNGTPAFWLGGADSGSQLGFPGYYAAWELEHAFDITDCTGVRLTRCSCDSVWGDGCYLGNTTGADGVILEDCNFRWTGRQGIGMSMCRNVTIDGVVVDHGRRAAIDMEPFKDSGFVTDVEIMNCTLTPLQTHFAAVGRGDVSRIYIHDNWLYGSGGTIICYDSAGKKRRKDWTVINNHRSSGYGSTQAVVRWTMTDNIMIDANMLHVSVSQSRLCVDFNNCQGVLTVTNNDFSGGCTIKATNSAPVTSSGNTFGADCP